MEKNDWTWLRFGSAAISQLAGKLGGTNNVIDSPGSMLTWLTVLTNMCLVSNSSIDSMVGDVDWIV